MKHIKNFRGFLNESENSQDFESEAKAIIKSGKIYGQKIPGYPFVLAVSGTGDDYGNDEAWLINSQDELWRWITTVSTSNKMFPDFSGEGYLPPVDEMEDDELEEAMENMRDKDSDEDDFQNGYRVTMFKDEAAMKAAIKASKKEYGDPDDLDSGEMYSEIIDGSYFPPRKLTRKW